MNPILVEILVERAAQDRKWGGASHDETHNSHDWVAYIVKHLGRCIVWPWRPGPFRYQMIRVAALAVAAIEWCDRRYPSQDDSSVSPAERFIADREELPDESSEE